MTLERNAYKALKSVVGSENISEDPAVLFGYTTVFGFILPFGPEAVVMPKNTEEVQGIIQVCNRYKVKYKAHSTGFYASSFAGLEGVVMVDLRRMNRLEIDEKNMVAVIEPYVTATQLQAEAMKKGLDCCIVSAGGVHSPLASATSFMGIGTTGLTTSSNQRNLLGVEWVKPTGEVMRIGSPGSDAGWFAGDGPGPDFRGIIKGMIGACGGLGIFTKIGFKLYPWPGTGPEKFERTGQHPQIGMKTPENFKFYYPYWETWEDMIEATYHIHEARVARSLNRIPPEWMDMNLTRTNDEFYELHQKNALPILRKHAKGWNAVIDARTQGEFAYKTKVFEKIVKDTNGKLLELSPEHEAVLLFGQINPSYIARGVFRPTPAGILSGLPSNFSQEESLGLLKKIMEEDEKCLEDSVKPGGEFLETGPEQVWAWTQEGRRLWTESIHTPDTEPRATKASFEYTKKALGAIEKSKGAFSYDVRFAATPIVEMFGPQLCNVQDWVRKIKNTFDPQNGSDHSSYISPEPPKLPPEELVKRLMAAKM